RRVNIPFAVDPALAAASPAPGGTTGAASGLGQPQGPFRNTLGIPSLQESSADRCCVGFATGLVFMEMEEMLAHHFNALTAGNEMKWSSVQPAPGRFSFVAADLQARFAEENGMKLVGHTL